MKSAPAYVVLASLLLAGCEAGPQADRITRDADGNPIVILTDEEVAAVRRPNPALQSARLTLNGQTYLLQMRETVLPSPPPLPDTDPNDGIVSVRDTMLHTRPDLAVSRASVPFGPDDRAEAQTVALAFCDHQGWSRVEAAMRQAPLFRPIDAPGDSNEWIFPNWCLPMIVEAGGA